jgi:hypothetical protein
MTLEEHIYSHLASEQLQKEEGGTPFEDLESLAVWAIEAAKVFRRVEKKQRRVKGSQEA